MSKASRDSSIAILNQANFVNQQQPLKTSSSTRQQQLSFSKKVAVFSDEGAPPEDDHYCRLLRGFRWHWKRPKIASGISQEERTGQFIPLKSPSKCSNFGPSTFASGTSSE
ncbi:FMRFamide receptor [Caerostris extrusa]|nr:FMRFamide receptor [Caerostris extrusa]